MKQTKLILSLLILFLLLSESVNPHSNIMLSNMNYTKYSLEIYTPDGDLYTFASTENIITLNDSSDYIIYINPYHEIKPQSNITGYTLAHLGIIYNILWLSFIVALFGGFFYGIKKLAFD